MQLHELTDLIQEEGDEGKILNHLRQSPIPKLEGRPRLLYHSGYYDGPLSGMCLYNDERHWFNCVEDELDFTDPNTKEYLRGRVYVVVKPDLDELKKENVRHALFEKYVGTHTRYDADGKRNSYGNHSPSVWWVRILRRMGVDTAKWWYRRKPGKAPSPNFNNSEVVAWWGSSHLNFDAYLLEALEAKTA